VRRVRRWKELTIQKRVEELRDATAWLYTAGVRQRERNRCGGRIGWGALVMLIPDDLSYYIILLGTTCEKTSCLWWR
jgi:hypothetical protein